MSFKYLRKFGPTLLLLGIATRAGAEPVSDAHWSEGQVSVWAKGGFYSAEDLQAALVPGLRGIRESFLAPYLPSAWGLWVDGTWTRTSGYWGEDLKTPDGRAAVLITPATAVDPVLSLSVLAHEATHLAHHVRHPREEAWVREGVALLAEYRITGRQHPAFRSGWASPETSLTAPLDAASPEYRYGSAQGAQYGAIAQYFYFMYKHCGGDALTSELLAEETGDLRGVAFVETALRRAAGTLEGERPAFCATFKDAFRQFQVARFTQDGTRRHFFVTTGADRCPRRASPVPLSPYSATAYAKPASGCGPDAELDGGASCLRVRFE